LFLNTSGFLEVTSIKRLFFQKIILDSLDISKPEDSGVEEVVIKTPGITTIIDNDPNKIWSLAFTRLMAEYFGLPSEGYTVTEKMENLCLHCFAGLPFHHGFVSAFTVDSTVKLTLR